MSPNAIQSLEAKTPVGAFAVPSDATTWSPTFVAASPVHLPAQRSELHPASVSRRLKPQGAILGGPIPRRARPAADAAEMGPGSGFAVAGVHVSVTSIDAIPQGGSVTTTCRSSTVTLSSARVVTLSGWSNVL